MEELSIKSFAKINIGLNIISRREDGFHNLQTIFFPLSLHDLITVKKSDYFHFESDDKMLIEDKNNLIIRAHRLIEESVKTKINCYIHLQKNIPVGAGLGGGSSNAASILKGLNELFSLNIEHKKLKELALDLGSDVPLFLEKLPAYAESRGEIIYPVRISFNGYLLIVNPGIHISTKWAFGKVIPEKPKVSLKELIKNDEIKFDDLITYATNDFEPIIFKEYPRIEEIKIRMQNFDSRLTLMTGTGSTVFGFFDDEEAANQAEQFFKCKNYFTYLQRVS
ncbi:MULTISPECIES: 4-(cytidine 5'-diphospho)-2-C-methyl-D-erythritol kinase [Ignavibacterium]|jgi:4-diphosphocytidyl-2-C-methyl-D-erythritol kinase|uniref:4-(cytidine 5'-diphospho)-2-C-methyl-D-erythritol kinase n=1 Tax=Ignavibacterium TaxID=795750 RepID=UPI0025C04AC8|nr:MULTISPECIES: 4-(cytidine 5'-diphospho)-2-C-methyl-D-erythritol kinase [Ignavibacterium]MBI5662866.1 4-(cytidine 5'-diphospho)-2-C-methyl-D-erythritol kinase [Ignavibacterium album]